MNVGDFMNENPPRIGMEATLAEALQMMADNKTRHIVVFDEGRDIAGILSDRDLAMYYDPVNMNSERWREAKVSQLMSADPVSIGSQAPIKEAAKLLLRQGVSALPVVDNGELTGILSEKDFVRHFVKAGG